MGRILYVTHDRDSVISNGIVNSITPYNYRQKGLTGPWPLIYAQVTYLDSDGPCCPQHGDGVELTWGVFERVCSRWHICIPEVGHKRRGARYDTRTLYLIPDNHEERYQCFHPSDAVEEMGMASLYDTVPAQDIVQELVDYLGGLPSDEHLHVVLLVDKLELRPRAGQAGSCRCGQIASPACDNRLCARCCTGCSRHADTSTAHSSTRQVAAVPQVVLPQLCVCGQPAASTCRGSQCARCCYDVLCTRHWAQSDSDSSEDTTDLFFRQGIAPAQQQQQPRCGCGQPAASTCSVLKCGLCCQDCNCRRHFDPPYPDQVVAAATGWAAAAAPHVILGGLSVAAPSASSSSAAAAAAAPAPARTVAAPATPPLIPGGLSVAAAPSASTAAPAATGDSATVVVSPSAASGGSLPPGRVYRHYRVPSSLGTAAAAGGGPAPAAAPSSSSAAAAAAASPATDFGGGQSTSSGSNSVASLEQWFDRLAISDSAQQSAGPSAAAAAAGPSAAASAGVRSATATISSSTHSQSTVQSTSSSSQEAPASSRTQRYEQLLHRLTELVCSNTLQQQLRAPMTELLDLVCDMRPPYDLMGGAEAGPEEEPHHSSSSTPAAASGRVKLQEAAEDYNTSSSSSSSRGQGLSPTEQLHQLQHCIICLDAPRSVVLLPCKHLVLCDACSRQLQQHASRDDPPEAVRRSYAPCPVCRQPAKQHMGGIIMA